MKAAWMMFSNTRVFTSCYNMEELNENSTCSILSLFTNETLQFTHSSIINCTLPVQDMEVKGINQNAQGGSRISQTGGGGSREGNPKKYEAKTHYLVKFKKTISRVFIKTEKNPSTFFHRHTTCMADFLQLTKTKSLQNRQKLTHNMYLLSLR